MTFCSGPRTLDCFAISSFFENLRLRYDPTTALDGWSTLSSLLCKTVFSHRGHLLLLANVKLSLGCRTRFCTEILLFPCPWMIKTLEQYKGEANVWVIGSTWLQKCSIPLFKALFLSSEHTQAAFCYSPPCHLAMFQKVWSQCYRDFKPGRWLELLLFRGSTKRWTTFPISLLDWPT